MDLSIVDDSTIQNTEDEGVVEVVVDDAILPTDNVEVVTPVSTNGTTSVVIGRPKFTVLTECIGLMQQLGCTDCEIKNSVIRQLDDHNSTIIEIDMSEFIQNINVSISNAKEKYNIMKALEVDDNVEWSNEDIVLKNLISGYEIKDHESVISFRKPVAQLMVNTYMEQATLLNRVSTRPENLIFSVEIQPLISKRIKSICDSVTTDVVTFKLKDTAMSIHVKSKHNQELNAHISSFTTNKQMPESFFNITSLPFKASQGSLMKIEMYKLDKNYLVTTKQKLFGTIPFCLYSLVSLQQD